MGKEEKWKNKYNFYEYLIQTFYRVGKTGQNNIIYLLFYEIIYDY